MSHVTYEWAMSHIYESCHTWMGHVTYESSHLVPHKKIWESVCRDSFSYVRHDSFLCVPWLIHMCDICEGTARPAASTTLLRLGTRPSGNLPTQRHSSTSSQHDHPAPRDTPFGEPKLCFWNNIFWTIDLPSTLVLCPSILQHYFVEAFIVIHKN